MSCRFLASDCPAKRKEVRSTGVARPDLQFPGFAMTRSQSTSRFVLVSMACVLSLAALVFTSLSMSRLRQSLQVLRRSNDARVSLEMLYSALKDAESGGRGYLISGDESYLKP